MRKFKILVLSLFLLMAMQMPVNAANNLSKETIKEYNLQISLLTEGNYYTAITDDDCIMMLEVLDPTDKSVPVNINEINTRSLGDEEFAPGTYTRTLRYSETINPTAPQPVTFRATWQVKFTIYADSTYPKITYVSGFTELSNFPSTSGPYLRRAQASSSSPAYAEATLRNSSQLYDGYKRILYMKYYLYGDDSGTVDVDITKNMG